ncbi:TPA: hypothetical protein ACGOVD_001118 [Streptococcus suis]
MTNQTKLYWKSGDVVKQGDTSSVFKLELRTNDNAVLNGPAKLQLIQGQGKIEYDVQVVDNQVTFNLPKALPIGDYIVEIEHAGYVFPSTNSVVLTVNENLGDIITDEIAELLSIDEYISRKLADYQAGQIDLDALIAKLNIQPYDDKAIKDSVSNIQAGLTNLGELYDNLLATELKDLHTSISELKTSTGQTSEYDDSQIRAQIADILAKIDGLKNHTSYDDSELKSRLTALENKPDNDTIYDDTIVNQRLTALESRPAGQSYDDTEVKQRLTALEQSNGAGSVSVRRAPMSYTLDRTTNPWTVYFDNGCSIVIRNGAASELPYWYNYGQMPSATQALTENFIPFQLIRLSQGLISYQQWSTSTRNVYTYNNVEVSNPINDINQYNWSGYTNQATGHVSLAKVLFALGIASESEILALGAVRI